jgi:hypothetical protein
VNAKAELEIEQIDALLAAWDERIRRMDENLIALEGDAIYQILAGNAGKRAALSGVSKERVYPALDAVSELFQHRDRLVSVIEKAKQIRASISPLTFWGNDDKMAEIVRLLRGPSIDLGHTVMPLAQRNLLDASYKDVILEPEALLASMVQTFNAARDVILRVSRAWEELEPLISQLSGEVRALSDLAASLNPNAEGPAELTEAERELAELTRRVQKDPIGVEGSVGGVILPRLKALRERLNAEVSARTRVLATLDRAHALRREVSEANARARALFEQAKREIEGAERHLKSILDTPLLDGLDQWLHKLDTTAQARRWSSAEVGLARWLETATSYLELDAAAATQAAALLGRREELSGRLSARRAQAAALLARSGEADPALSRLAEEAAKLLGQRPWPIERATRAVEVYEAAVLSRSGR